MGIPAWITIRSCFKIICFLALCSMISYWFYKFVIEDKDLCLVDYKKVERGDEFLLPMVSICVENPFLDNKLKEISPEMNSSVYLRYLQGEVFDDKFGAIDYNNVTMSLSDYYVGGCVYWKNGSNFCHSSQTDILKHLYVTFSGFRNTAFYKCFGIEINDKYKSNIKYSIQHYKQGEFLDGSRRSSGNSIFVFFHHPNQFIFSNENFKAFYNDRTSGTDYLWVFELKGIEVLKTRNKRIGSCVEEFKDFDELVLKRHVEANGCRAPYHRKFEKFPVCSTKKQIKQLLHDANIAGNDRYPVPCQTVSKIDYEINYNDLGGNGEWFVFSVRFPDQIKVITQNRAVDIHTLVGNIGGYLGLFLGYAIIQLPDLVLAIYKYLKNVIRNRNISQQNRANVTEQNSAELTTVSSLSDGVNESSGEEDTNTSSFEEVTNERLDKLDEVFENLTQKFDKRLDKLEGLFGNLNKKFDKISHNVDKDVKDINTNLVLVIDNKTKLINRKLEDHDRLINQRYPKMKV